MEDRLMTDGHAHADCQRSAGVRMADGAVLEVGLFAEDDGRVVGAHHCAEPDARPRPEPDVADQVRGRRSPGILAELRSSPVDRVQGHSSNAPTKTSSPATPSSSSSRPRYWTPKSL